MGESKNFSTPGVFLIDDSPRTAEWVSKLLSSRSDLRWLGSAASCAEAEEALVGLEPDVVILDLKIPGESTTAFIRRLRGRGPRPYVLMLSGYVDKRDVQSAVVAGAWGYLGKDASPDELINAIHKTADGEVVFSASARKAILDL